MSGTISPAFHQQELDNNGDPLSGGLVYTYEAGTSTPLSTYTDATLVTPNANPTVCDSAGRYSMYFGPYSYKVIVKTSAGVTLYTRDVVAAVPATNIDQDITGTAGTDLSAGDSVYMSDGSGALTAGSWYKTDSTEAYSSSGAKAYGFTPNAIASGESGSIRKAGRITGLTGLVAGTIYYASSTPGDITANKPANVLAMGVADSTSSLILPVRSEETTGLGGVNLLKDSAFLIWAAGDALAPTHWVMSGAGAAIARETGATKIKIGANSAKLTAGAGATAYLLQQLLTTATYDGNWLDDETVSIGAWVWCDAASKAALYVNDGATNSSSSFHTGSSTWEWLTLSHTVDTSATLLSAGVSAAASAVVYLSGPTMLLGASPPGRYQPSPCVYGTIRFSYPGTVATATQWDTWVPARPALIKQVQLYSKTAPTGANLIVDINTWDGSAFTTAFTTKPTIVAAANSGGAVPDGTYARRCLAAYVATTAYPTSAGQMMTMDVDQVGSSVAGADLSIHVRVLQFTSPLEQFLGVTEIQ